MSTLPQGQVWISRPLDIPDVLLLWIRGEPIPVSHGEAWRAAPGPHKAMLTDEETVLHTFGIAAQPGEALLLGDQDGWCWHCPDCRTPLMHGECVKHGAVTAARLREAEHWHARIVRRKTLEEVK